MKLIAQSTLVGGFLGLISYPGVPGFLMGAVGAFVGSFIFVLIHGE